MDLLLLLRNQLTALVLVLPVLLGFLSPVAAEEKERPEPTHIFFSAGCADCWPYVEKVLLPALQARGEAVDPRIHDYTAPDERRLLLEVAIQSSCRARSPIRSMSSFPRSWGNWSFSVMCAGLD
jgi:hypothetical protein